MPVKYKGPDVFYGLPARDLTDEEFDALDPQYKRHVRASDSYEITKSRKTEDSESKSSKSKEVSGNA